MSNLCLVIYNLAKMWLGQIFKIKTYMISVMKSQKCMHDKYTVKFRMIYESKILMDEIIKICQETKFMCKLL